MTHFVERQAVLPFGHFVLERHLRVPCGWPGRPLRLKAMPKVITGTHREEVALRILRECSGRIAEKLDVAPRAFFQDGARCVSLWEALEIRVGADGRRISARSIEPHARSRPYLNASLASPLSEERWLAVFEPLMANVYCELVPAMPRRVFPRWIADWARPILHRTYAGVVDFPGLRHAILAFLAPDLLTRSIANRIAPGKAPGEGLFNWCGAHRDRLAVHALENPGWLPWLALVQHDPGHRDPLRALERRLKDAGIADRAFARLPEWGFEAMGGMEDRAPFVPLEAYAQCANVLERIRARGQAPRAFAGAFAAAALDDDDEVDPRRIEVLFPDWFARALWDEARREPDAQALRDEFQRAQTWLAIARPEPDANQRRAGWRWIVGHAAAWPRYPVACESRDAKLRKKVRPRIELGPLHALLLPDAASMAAEGAAMANCLGTHAARLLAAGHLVYSLRDSGTGERLACMSAVLRDRCGDAVWLLGELAGKGNAPVPPEIERAAGAVIDACNAVAAGVVSASSSCASPARAPAPRAGC